MDNTVDGSGFLTTDPAGAAPSNVDMKDPDGTQTPGFLSSLESFGSSVISKVENGVEVIYAGAKGVASDVGSGVESVAQKGVNIVTGGISSITGNVVIILVVVGVALVMIAKSGAVKISR